MPVLSPFAGKQDTADAEQRAAGWGRGRAGSLPCSSSSHGSAVPRDPAGGGQRSAGFEPRFSADHLQSLQSQQGGMIREGKREKGNEK